MNPLDARVTWDSKWKHPHFYLSGSYQLVIDRVQMNLAYWHSVNYCSFHFGFLLFYLTEKLAVVVASKIYNTNAVIIYHHLVIHFLAKIASLENCNHLWKESVVAVCNLVSTVKKTQHLNITIHCAVTHQGTCSVWSAHSLSLPQALFCSSLKLSLRAYSTDNQSGDHNVRVHKRPRVSRSSRQLIFIWIIHKSKSNS